LGKQSSSNKGWAVANGPPAKQKNIKGVLKNEGTGQWGMVFSKLAEGYITDVVSNYFSCVSCGQLFHLHAETYQGGGGAFEKIGAIDERLQEET
jgi:hypothetical protein